MKNKVCKLSFFAIIAIGFLFGGCSKDGIVPPSETDNQKITSAEKAGKNLQQWAVGETYQIGDEVIYRGAVYRCRQAHTVHSSNRTPTNCPALWSFVSGAEVAYPFPANGGGSDEIIPGVSKDDMNSDIEDYYSAWKEKYIKAYSGGYKVSGNATPETETKTSSEAMGYGMIIAVFMEDKDLFDGLWRAGSKYRSAVSNSNLIDWTVGNYGESSATDGDLDIAYGLCLAAYQWSSQSPFTDSYMELARQHINEIIDHTIYCAGPTYSDFCLNLGDWNNESDDEYEHYKFSSRISDWMPSHLYLFNAYVQNYKLTKLRNFIPRTALYLQENFSPNHGFLPDFIQKEDKDVYSNYEPVHSTSVDIFFESEHDDQFNYNACRFPLRFAVAHKHEYRHDYTQILSNFMEGAGKVCTSGNVSQFKAGWNLDGSVPASWDGEKCFSGPLLAAAVAINDSKFNKESNWNWLSNFNTGDGGYYNDTLGLLSMLCMSDNWWEDFPE